MRVTVGHASRRSGFPSCLIILFCALSVAFVASCSRRGDVKPEGPPYAELVEKWTRKGSVYHGMEARLIAHATYRGWGLREAYVREYAKRYRIDDYEREKLLADERAGYEEGEELFLAVSSPVEKWNDLQRSDSVWRLYLENDRGERVEPIRIRRVDEESPLVREFYPRLDLWGRGYLVTFPKYSGTGETTLINDETRAIILVITGVLGETEIEWRME